MFQLPQKAEVRATAIALLYPRLASRIQKASQITNEDGVIILAESHGQIAMIKSQSNGNYYTLRDIGNGLISCDCPDLPPRMKTGQEACKHVLAYLLAKASQ